MNKRGKLFIMFICALGIIMLISAYIKLVGFYGQHEDYKLTKDIGGKQGAILKAIWEGERIELYTDQAASNAAAEASMRASCGEPYLGRSLISGSGTCDPPVDAFSSSLLRQLAGYPARSIAASIEVTASEPTNDGTIVRVGGTVRVPIGTNTNAGGTFKGVYADWPTDDRRITGLFGNRDLKDASATKNHPGIDIGSFGRPGEPVSSITDGTAVFFEKGEDSFIRVESGELIIEYVHVRANFPSGVPTQISKQQVIGETVPHRNAPHVHLQVRMKSVTATTAEALGPEHIGPSGEQTAAQSFAVTRSADNAAFLDPICFFERAMVSEVLASAGLLKDGVFDACDAYEQAFGLSSRLAVPVDLREAPQDAQAAATDAGPLAPSLKHPKVEQTYQRLKQQNLLATIAAAAQDAGVEKELLAAIITKESDGDPLAVSQTGCVGIAQFCMSTAQGFPEQFKQLTKCDCAGQACRSQSTRSCSPDNDDRFKPTESIVAQSQLVKRNNDRYGKYSQGVAFSIGAYNGGPGPIDAAITETGKADPSWEEVRFALEKLDVDKFEPSTEGKRDEVIDYVDNVLVFYDAWGGRSFAGTAFTSEQLGYYDVRVAMTTVIPAGIQDALSDINAEIAACETQSCISAALRETRRGVNVFPIDLADPSSVETGCLTEEERVQAFVANQIAACKRSPDSACGCAFEPAAGVDATLAITSDRVRVRTIRGEVAKDSAPLMEGLSYEVVGDGSTTTQSHYYLFAPAYAVNTSSMTLTMGSGAAAVSFADAVASTSVETPATVRQLYKGAYGLGFTPNADARVIDACVAKPLPQAYCIDLLGQATPIRTLFYVDMAAHSVVEDPPELKRFDDAGVIDAEGRQLFVIELAGPSYPYVLVTTYASGQRVEEWLRVVPFAELSVDDKARSLAQSGRYVIAGGSQGYLFYFPRYADSLSISFVDENLRVGPALDVPV